MSYHIDQTADFSVPATRGFTETGIGFVAEGNAVIFPDGSVSADQVRVMVSHMGATTSTAAGESHEQRQDFEAISEVNERNQATAFEKVTVKKKSKPNRFAYVVLFTSFVIVGAVWRR